MKARKKPVVIDFIEVTNPLNFSEIREWVNSFGDDFRDKFVLKNDMYSNFLYVNTFEGTSYEVTALDVIIRGIQGEYYPCKKDIFNQTYYETI